MEEIWKVLEQYPEYEVCNTGKVRKGINELSVYKRSDGYLSVPIRRKSRLLHRLVATTFHPNPLNLPEVNHLDGDKSNCHESNLKWCTSLENCRHKIEVLGYTKKGGYSMPSGLDCNGSIPVAGFDRNGVLKVVFESGSLASKHFGMSPNCILNQIERGFGTANGFHWKRISPNKYFELEHKLSEGEAYTENVILTNPIKTRPIISLKKWEFKAATWLRVVYPKQYTYTKLSEWLNVNPSNLCHHINRVIK